MVIQVKTRYLFRGKRIGRGWITGTLADPETIAKNADRSDLYFVDPTTIGQCTCLRDKNGDLIFEGDIVKNHVRDQIYRITYCQIALCIRADIIGSSRFENLWSLDSDDIEIIGNVFDNPELNK